MAARFVTGLAVQTPLGKGVVRAVRNGGRLLVEIAGRAVELKSTEVTELAERSRRQARPLAHGGGTSVGVERRDRRAAHEVDLHGLTVIDALLRAERAVNEALLADYAELRLIHGRSGGRIRAALHRRLAEIPSVRAFALDPANHGVTVVRFL